MTHGEYLRQLDKMPFEQYKSVIDVFEYYKTLNLIKVPQQRNVEITDQMVEEA